MLALREARSPQGPALFYTRSLLGGALAGQKKYTEAEPLLLQGYRGLKAHRLALSAQQAGKYLPEALERLVRLYDDWGKPDEAGKWRKELQEPRKQ